MKFLSDKPLLIVFSLPEHNDEHVCYSMLKCSSSLFSTIVGQQPNIFNNRNFLICGTCTCTCTWRINTIMIELCPHKCPTIQYILALTRLFTANSSHYSHAHLIAHSLILLVSFLSVMNMEVITSCKWELTQARPKYMFPTVRSVLKCSVHVHVRARTLLHYVPVQWRAPCWLH